MNPSTQIENAERERKGWRRRERERERERELTVEGEGAREGKGEGAPREAAAQGAHFTAGLAMNHSGGEKKKKKKKKERRKGGKEEEGRRGRKKVSLRWPWREGRGMKSSRWPWPHLAVELVTAAMVAGGVHGESPLSVFCFFPLFFLRFFFSLIFTNCFPLLALCFLCFCRSMAMGRKETEARRG